METPLAGRALSFGFGAALCTCTLIVTAGIIGSLPTPPQPEPALSTPPPPSRSSCEKEWEALRGGLRTIRSGEQGSSLLLTALAAQIENNSGRADAARATRHLTSLSGAGAYIAEVAFKKIDEALDEYELASRDDDAERHGSLLDSLAEMTAELDLLEDPLPAAYARRVLAELSLSQRDPGAALTAVELAELALGTYERVGFHEQEVEALEVLARAHLRSADLSAARSEATRGLELAREIEDALYQSRCLRVLVQIADRTGAGLDREKLLREWGLLSQRSGIEEWWAWTRQTFAWHIDEDQPKHALAFLRDAIARRRELSGRDPLASQTLREQANSLEAMAYIRDRDFERATSLLRGNSTSKRSRLLLAYLNLRRLDEASATEEGALLIELAALLEEDWVAALPPELRDEGDIYTGEYLLRRGEAEHARAALERAVQRVIQRERGLEESSAIRGGSSLGGEALGLHAVQLLARAYLELDLPLSAARISEEMQARTLRAAGSRLEELHLNDWASSNELGLLSWVIGPDEGVAIWIGRDGESDSLLIPFGRRSVQRAVGRLRQALRDERHVDSESIGLELAQALIPSELLERLSDARGESLLLLTHGPLEALPMNALCIPTADVNHSAFLAEAATLRTLPGLPALAPGTAHGISQRWVLAGAPSAADGAARLPGAERELREIQSQRDCELLSGEEMGREVMIAAIKDDACLHIATHIEWVDTAFGPSPALELSSGELLSVVDLPSHLGARELVVLAGCESAGGRMLDGEGALGFSRAFLSSGTRGVVATLWPVRDEAAESFGCALHQSLIAQGSPSVAVRAAAMKLRESGEPDWAAFQLLGRD